MSGLNITKIASFIILQFLALSNSRGQAPIPEAAPEPLAPRPPPPPPLYYTFLKKHVMASPIKAAEKFISAYPDENLPPVISVVKKKDEPTIDAYTFKYKNIYESDSEIAYESFYTKPVKQETEYRCLRYKKKILIAFEGTPKKPVHFETYTNPKDFFMEHPFKSSCKFLVDRKIKRSYNSGEAVIEGQGLENIDSGSFNTTDEINLLKNSTIGGETSSETIAAAST